MRSSANRRFRFVAVLLVTVMASSCTSGESEGSGAAGPVPVGTDSAVEAVDSRDPSMDLADPSADETAIGDDPVNGGDVGDEADPVIESDDGQATEPVGGGAEIAAPDQTPSAAEACAAVEFGYLGLLEGDSSPSRIERLRQGAESALAIEDSRYADSGFELLAALDSDADTLATTIDAADTLLRSCASDGFERLT